MNTKFSQMFVHLSITLIILCTFPLDAQEVSWNTMASILKTIRAPHFPKKDFGIIAYGAVEGGKTDCTDAIAKAIGACAKSGGGRVVIPQGVFLTGAIHLKSNVNLHLRKGAVLKFTTDKSKYLPVVFTRWEGVECMNYSPLIYAYGQKNIAVTGAGLLDGQGANENWWSWKGTKEYGGGGDAQNQNAARKKLLELADSLVPVEKRIFGEGSYLRPSFFQPYNCSNVLVEGVTFKDSPMWFLNPVLCENVIIRGVTVEGLGPNNDGCDPECCKNVLIEKCYFDTGDDCIAIKSGRNTDGRRVNRATENVVIRDCTMKEGHGGVVIGSEISGGVRNVFAENCSMDSPNLERALRFKTNSVRGGVVENIFARNIAVGQVSDAVIKVDFYYEEGDKGQFTPVMKNFNFSKITSQKSPFAIWIKAYDRSPLENFTLSDCTFDNVAKESVLKNVKTPSISNVQINGKTLKLD